VRTGVTQKADAAPPAAPQTTAHIAAEDPTGPGPQTAAGSAREAYDRQKVAEHLRVAGSFRVIGSDPLAKRTVDLLANGSITAVDAVLETDKAPVLIRFRLDEKGRVVDFRVQ
jgi:hypothetical protein